MSTVSILNPALPSRPAMSFTSANGETRGDIPPRLSNSANCNEVRSSKSVSPPNMTPRKGASGLSTLLICESTEGRSLIQWRESEDNTASKVSGGYGIYSSSWRISRVRLISLLKGRSASRYKRVAEESTAVRCEMRVDNGGDSGFLGSGSGSGRVRALAILQALAPRSKTCGKWRLISWHLDHKYFHSSPCE